MSCNANAQTFHADLSGFQELGALNAETGAIFTPGTGTLDLKLDQKLQMLTYTLTYSGLTSPVLQAHIHFGQIHVPGGIFLFLCTNLGNGPVGKRSRGPRTKHYRRRLFHSPGRAAVAVRLRERPY
jgi:CHRD domain